MNEPICPRCDSGNVDVWDMNEDDFTTYVCRNRGMEFDVDDYELDLFSDDDDDK